MKRLLIALAVLAGVNGHAAAEILQPITYYTQTLSTAQGASTAAPTVGNAVRLTCTTGCWVAMAASPVNHNTGKFNFIYLPTNETVTIKTRPNRYIVHLGTGSGTLYITEMSP